MTKTATEMMLEVAERHMPNTLDALIHEYVNTLHPTGASRLVAVNELRKFSEWFREKHSDERTGEEL